LSAIATASDRLGPRLPRFYVAAASIRLSEIEALGKEKVMRVTLAKNWWSLVLRGVVAVLLGVIAFAWPGITLTALVFLFAGYALVDGALSLAGAVRAVEARDRWGALLIEGLAGILAAVVTVIWPAITALALVYVIAAWAIITGVAEIVAAVRLRRYVRHEWLLGLAGLASVVFGVLMAAVPLAGALVIALWVGVYMLIFGGVMVALGFRLRSWTHGEHMGAPMPLPAH
jgi:uncharacterized membrane protein HdeD (DUF308 family)